MNEIAVALYFLIGFLVGIWRISKVSKEEDSSMACIGGVAIMLLWPLYLVYKHFKR